MASDTSIGRKVGSPLRRAVARIASIVILLSSGATAMKASTEVSRTISLIWSAPNCATATLSGSTPDSFRMTRNRSAFTRVRPTTPTLCPGRSSIALIFDLESLRTARRAGPVGAQSTTTFLRMMATDMVPSGISSSVHATARSAVSAASSAMLSTGPAVVTTARRTVLPSRANVCAIA
jgi:hypothetical protein